MKNMHEDCKNKPKLNYNWFSYERARLYWEALGAEIHKFPSTSPNVPAAVITLLLRCEAASGN